MDFDLDYYKYKKYKALYKNMGDLSGGDLSGGDLSGGMFGRKKKKVQHPYPTHTGDGQFEKPAPLKNGDKVLMRTPKYGWQPATIVGESTGKWSGRKKWDKEYKDSIAKYKKFPYPLWIIKYNPNELSSDDVQKHEMEKCPSLVTGDCIYPQDRLIWNQDKYNERVNEIQKLKNVEKRRAERRKRMREKEKEKREKERKRKRKKN